MRNRKALVITVGGIVAISVATVMLVSGPSGAGFSFPWVQRNGAPIARDPAGEDAGGVSDRASSSRPASASKSAVPLARGKQLGSGSGVNFSSYLEFMDSLGRKPTPEEEDAIIANSNRDPQVLLGLALANSSRAAQFLREVLEKDPDNPLVHYGILRYGDAGFDVLASAQKLVSLNPNDAELWYAAASAALKAGDRTLATDYLRKAAAQTDFATLHNAVIAANLEAYRLGGTTEENAQIRVALENHQTIADMAFADLYRYLWPPSSGTFKIAPGNEEMAALFLDGQQKLFNTKALTLDSYFGAQVKQSIALKEFVGAAASGENPAAAKYLSAPASELLSTATAEWLELQPVLPFGNDKPGVYRRLSGDQQQELISRIRKDGELSAFLWAYEQRPDIFRSPDFKPQSYSKKAWTEYLSHVGVALSTNQKK